MAKTFPVRLEVEEVALGTVLRKLHDMPGIAKLDLDLGHGGNGAGRAKLEAVAQSDPRKAIVEALANGPLSIDQIMAAIGATRTRTYALMTELKKAHVTKSAGHGKHELVLMRAPKAKKTSGRAAPGSGNALLVGVLKSEQEPMPTKKLRQFLSNNGMSPNSISGVLDRAKRDGIIKGGKDGYVLTAKAERMNGEMNGHG